MNPIWTIRAECPLFRFGRRGKSICRIPWKSYTLRILTKVCWSIIQTRHISGWCTPFGISLPLSCRIIFPFVQYPLRSMPGISTIAIKNAYLDRGAANVSEAFRLLPGSMACRSGWSNRKGRCFGNRRIGQWNWRGCFRVDTGFRLLPKDGNWKLRGAGIAAANEKKSKFCHDIGAV